MLVAGYFGTLLNSKIAGIPIYNFIIFTNQHCSLCDIVGIRFCDRNSMHQPAAGFHTNVAFHPPLLIRRLTPLECERLQGFPDGWTDLPGTSDSARYKALGNSVAIPCVEFIMRGIAMAAGY